MQYIDNVVSNMGKRQICFMIDEEALKEFEQIRDRTGLPVSRQIELKLTGYSIVEEKHDKTAVQLSKKTVECLKKIDNKGEIYDDVIKRLICEVHPELKGKLYGETIKITREYNESID